MAETNKRRLKQGIRFKLALFIGVLIVALMTMDVFWNIDLQQQQSKNEAQEKAKVLADEMRAVWDFIDMNQDTINRNDDGTFRTKALVCVVSAKSVSTLFTTNTNYTIRFTNQTPRQNANAPDDFENEAIEAFKNDDELDSYSGIMTDESGERVFRYVEPLRVTETCLECHGDPAGEMDQFGYEKEGMQLGDIGGAMSITEPMDIYDQAMQKSVLQQVAMMLLVLVIASIGIYIAASRLVLRPVDSLRHAAKQIGEGNFNYKLEPEKVKHPDELSEFGQDFNKMARRLETLCTDLESEVAAKTDKLSTLNDLLLFQKTELKRTLDRLSEETAYKNEFFAIVSHELRTPLTSILAYARILSENTSLDDKTHAAIEEIEANGTILLNMVNNILTISKVEAHKSELLCEPVDFVDLIGFIKTSLEPVARNKSITLTSKVEPDVPLSMADWEKLRRIIENLVDNAIKYTHVGGKVDINVTFENAYPDTNKDALEKHAADTINQEGTIIIKVIDDGMGIDEDDLPNIFEKYNQAGQSANRRYKGTGLGLAVVKELSELHGGSVSVTSKLKCGSAFTVRIPYVPVDTEEYDEDTAC